MLPFESNSLASCSPGRGHRSNQGKPLPTRNLQKTISHHFCVRYNTALSVAHGNGVISTMFEKTGWDSKFEIKELRMTESSSGEKNRIVKRKSNNQPTNKKNQPTKPAKPTNKTSKTNQHNLTNQRKPTKPTELPTSENPQIPHRVGHHARCTRRHPKSSAWNEGSVDRNTEVEKKLCLSWHLYKQS